MVGRKKQKNTKANGPRMAQVIQLQNNLIDKLYIKEGNRIDYKVIGPDYIKGLYLRYSPLTQKKVFVLKYNFKGKIERLTLKPFLPGEYGSEEVSEEIIRLRKKYYNNGKWQYSPREELLTIEELEGKQNYKVREVIRKAIENEFPRITKVGKLDQKTQQVYSRLYLGSERVKHFTYKNDDKEFGRIRLKKFKSFEEFWKKLSVNKSIQSLYDSSLGSGFIKDIKKGHIELFINNHFQEYGSKINARKGLQYLWNYANKHLKAFGAEGLIVNPTHNLDILRTDEVKYVGTKYNDLSFGKDLSKEIEEALYRLSNRFPFSAEAILLTRYSRFRLAEGTKLKKADVKEDHISLRKEIQKDRSKGTNKDIPVYFNPELVRLLEHLHKQRSKHSTSQFSPWLFPNINQAFDEGKPYHPRLEPKASVFRQCWEAVKQELNFEGSIKTLRKTFITLKVDTMKTQGLTEEDAIQEVSQEVHSKNSRMVKTRYYKPDNTSVIKEARKLGQVLKLKINK